MDQQTPPPPPNTTAVTATATSQSVEPSKPSPPPPAPQQPQPQQPLPSTSLSSTTNPNSISKPSNPLISQPQSLQSISQPRPHSFSRSLPQQLPHIPHFSSPHSSLPSPSPSVAPTSTPSVSAPISQRGGMAIGVPAQHSASSSQHQPFSSIGHQYGGLPNPSGPQVRPSMQGMQGMQGMGMIGSLGSASQMRPGVVPAHHQQRPVQPSFRSPSSLNTPPAPTQNFQGSGYPRVSSVGSASHSTLQNVHSPNQPWLSGSQGKPPLPNHSYRAQGNTTPMQQRSHIPQQHNSLSPASQQQQVPSVQSQQLLPTATGTPHQLQEISSQQISSLRTSQSLPHPHHIARVQNLGNQRPSSLSMVQANAVQVQSRIANAETESGNRILSKRSIHALVSQIDPSESLDADVEDILVDIADDFVDSITTFGCSLAKHRKSDTLEAKDILLHLERNWNIALPGFSGDEIKTYKKPPTNDIHKERLAVIKKSISASETNTKNSVGQTAVTAKSNLAKTPGTAIVSANLKTREVS